mgnify:CR=1 FL=1
MQLTASGKKRGIEGKRDMQPWRRMAANTNVATLAEEHASTSKRFAADEDVPEQPPAAPQHWAVLQPADGRMAALQLHDAVPIIGADAGKHAMARTGSIR